jgi:hypothetical protein
MFLDRLVAVGEVFQKYGLDAVDMLKLLSDVQEDPRFLANVAIIELALDDGAFRAALLPLQVCGEYEREETPPGKRTRKVRVNFLPDINRGLVLPFVIPASGNRQAPQGKYGVPVYPVYPRMWEGLSQSAAGFLQGRLRRTEHLPRDFTGEEVNQVAALLEKTAASMIDKVGSEGNPGNGLIALIIPQPGGPYSYLDKQPLPGDRVQVAVGESVLYPGRYIVGHLPVIVEYFRASKIAEGAEKGTAGSCRLCGRPEAVSAYSKAWPWLASTWHPPFAACFKQGDTVTDIASAVGALCPACYLSLAIGAGVFREVGGILPQWLRRELFLPVASAGGRREAARSGRVPAIQGSVLVLPVEAQVVDDGGLFKKALEHYRRRRPPRPGSGDRALAAITGIQATLPEELCSDHYRLSMVYYTESNAEIHLRAVVEDVLPSVTVKLQEIIDLALQQVVPVRKALGLKGEGWVAERYGSLPYLLVRAYGGCYLWTVLSEVLHRRPLSGRRFAAGAASRMNGLAKESLLGPSETARGQAWYDLREEVYFYALFRKFLLDYSGKILSKGGDDLSDWRELQALLTDKPAEEMAFAGPEEIGFAAGYLVRHFGRWYYGKLEKDFMRHRVMTFGSDLRPEDIWKRALSRFQEYGSKLDLHITDDFRRRAAIVECEYRRLRPAIEKQKAEFMAAFWSGYALALSPGKSQNGRDE